MIAQRASRPAQAQQVLLHAFLDEPQVLNAGGHLAAIRRLVEAGIGGGRICARSSAPLPPAPVRALSRLTEGRWPRTPWLVL